MPTAPLVSGGATLTLNPDTPCPIPSNPKFVAGLNFEGALVPGFCSTLSGCPAGFNPGGSGIRRTGLASCFLTGPRRTFGRSRTAGETSWCTLDLTDILWLNAGGIANRNRLATHISFNACDRIQYCIVGTPKLAF